MSDLTRTWHIDNLRLAWRRVRSNPDRTYKSYFRELYTAYAIADETLLSHLQSRLRRGVFQPTDACKIFFPKPSGILRPYSLLAIEDQIVYQSIANTVAEKLFPHVRHRYNKEVFGHLYAGSSSPWFYRKWSEGYKAFNTAAEEAFKSGYVWTASFDLTAFYDSIDHHVLRRMIEDIGVDRDLGVMLTELLTKWTATSTRIYHNHGIPQGPLSSGLIAETVLKHFDDRRNTKHDVRYFRYVDDIRLFAKKEVYLRHALVVLDRLSKDVGLFPQSSKIDIHEVKSIEKELKSISNPIEPVLTGPELNQNALRSRIVELSPRDKHYEVENPTRFKYLVARAAPSSRLADRLWRIYARAPQYYPQLAYHLSKFERIPERHATRLIDEIVAQELYPAIRASLIRAGIGRLPESAAKRGRSKLKPLWKPKQNQPDLADALWRWLHHEKHLTDAQIKHGLLYMRPPWLRMSAHFGTPWFDISTAHRENWLNASLRDESADVAISAAWLCGLLGVAVRSPIRSINPHAKLVLKDLGLVRRANASVCGIQQAVEEMTGKHIPVQWRKLFGKGYKRTEAQLVTCKGYFKTSATAWVNSMDVFIDLLLDALYRTDSALGAYRLGDVGTVVTSARLKSGYPAVYQLLNGVHAKRYESNLSHAVMKKNKKPTKPIKFKWLNTGARLLRRAVEELHSKGF